MDHQDLIRRFSGTTGDQEKAIFSTLFIVTNRLQTLFDSRIPDITLKQFMLLSIVRQSQTPLSLTRTGQLLGCSRQNVKKLAQTLQAIGFLLLQPDPADPRALCLQATEHADRWFRSEFSVYAKELDSLFSVYTPEEIETLFRLVSRLYAGVDRLAQAERKELDS